MEEFMVRIDICTYLNCKEDVSLDAMKNDFNAFCAKYGKAARTELNYNFTNDDEINRLNSFVGEKEPTPAEETPAPVEEAPKPKKTKAKKTEEAPAPVEEAPAVAEPTTEEAPKDEIDLPEFPPRDEVTKEALRDLLRAVKENSNETLGLRSVYANAGKDGKTFASLSADEYAVMYEEGRKVLWQLMHS
jgi:hypothetical protein